MSRGISEASGVAWATAMGRALEAWTLRGDPAPLGGWLERELDTEGVPFRLGVESWVPALEAIAGAYGSRPSGWPELFDARAEGLMRAAIRFGRPDGSSILGEAGAEPGRWARLSNWADRLSDPSLSTVLRRWSPRRATTSAFLEEAPPPLPAFSCVDRPLAILRADWSARGDWLAIDHRGPGGLLELAGLGRPWLGPRWRSEAEGGSEGPGRPTFWKTGPYADVAEWSFRGPAGRVTRQAVLFRGRGLALLADQVDGPAPTATMRIDLADGVEGVATGDAESPALALSAGRGRSARMLPIGLAGRSTEGAGSIEAADRTILLRQPSPGGRCWLPLLISWRPDRDRRPVRWRRLTVSEKSSVCPPGVAFAARIAWGAGEGLVIYRSLARPALRCFLGHQTSARFLVGLFTRSGDVEPFLKIDG